MTERAQTNRLSRSRRIQRTREFLGMRRDGSRLACGCLIANWKPLPGNGLSRLGVVTSRKVGHAVVRNRARRLLRESFRLHQHELQSVDLILVARPSIAGKGFAAVEHDFVKAMRRANVLQPR